MRLPIISAAALAAVATAQGPPFPTSCTGVRNNRYAFSVNSGWEVTKIGSVRQPRTLVFDPLGHLLILQAGYGITAHSIEDGCLGAAKVVNQNIRYNHGLDLRPDGKKLYVSSETTVWEFDYDPATMTATNQRVVVQGIDSGIHNTRTVKVVPQKPNLLLVSVGSNANFDMQAGNRRATVRGFDMANVPSGGYQFASGGYQMGWGMRNEIALAFDPNGNLWGAENSGDDFRRNGRDIHIDNPAEELNYLGDPTVENTQWYGYPNCFTVWDPSAFTDVRIPTGGQFVYTPDQTNTDATCATKSKAPRLSFQAHSAPIGAVFDANATNLYVTFHGSWDRQPATGYKVVQVPFHEAADGSYEPVAAADSMTGYSDVFGAQNPGACQSQSLQMSSCFRLAGIVWDRSFTRLYVSSDNQAEGEVWVLRKKGT